MMWAVLVSNAVVGVGSPGIALCSLRYESSPAGAVPFPLLLLVFRSRVWSRDCMHDYSMSSCLYMQVG